MDDDKSAIELKNLLTNWKLEKLYATLKDQDIFLEELEMMTLEHLEIILKDYKMGVRIRFEHNFKKWRNSLGKPLDKNETTFQCNKCEQKKKTTIDQVTQTEQNNNLKRQKGTDNNESNKTTVVKVLHGSQQIREVLNQIDKFKTNECKQQEIKQQQITVSAISPLPQLPKIPATITQIIRPTLPTNNLNLEQPTTTTFQETNTTTTLSLQKNPIQQGFLKSATSESSPTLNQTSPLRYIRPKTLLTKIGQTSKTSKTTKTQKTKYPKTTSTLPLQINSIQESSLKSSTPEADDPITSKFIIPKASLALSPKSSLILARRPKSPDIKLPVKRPLLLSQAIRDQSPPKFLLPKQSPPDTTKLVKQNGKSSRNSKPPAANVLQLYLLRKYGSRGFKDVNGHLKMTSVLKVLIESGVTGQRLLQQYEENPIITEQQREFIIDLLCQYHKNFKLDFNLKISYMLEIEILELFPSEKLEFYRTEKYGRLYKKYFNEECILMSGKMCPDSSDQTVEIHDSSSDIESSTDEAIINVVNSIEESLFDDNNSNNLNEFDVKMEFTSD